MATTPIFLLGKSHGQRSLADYSPWGCTELDTTEQLRTYPEQYLFIVFFIQFLSINSLKSICFYFPDGY